MNLKELYDAPKATCILILEAEVLCASKGLRVIEGDDVIDETEYWL